MPLADIQHIADGHDNEAGLKTLESLGKLAQSSADLYKTQAADPRLSPLEQAEKRGKAAASQELADQMTSALGAVITDMIPQGKVAQYVESAERSSRLLENCVAICNTHHDFWEFLTVQFGTSSVERLVAQNMMFALVMLDAQALAASVAEWKSKDHEQTAQALKALTDFFEAVKTGFLAGSAGQQVVQ